jgi:hypothetical protein
VHDLVATLPFGARNPLYAVLHESSYADGVATRLAEEEWPRLFDPAVLADVDVPCAAVVYVDDPFVEVGLSLETAAPWCPRCGPGSPTSSCTAACASGAGASSTGCSG